MDFGIRKSWVVGKRWWWGEGMVAVDKEIGIVGHCAVGLTQEKKVIKKNSH